MPNFRRFFQFDHSPSSFSSRLLSFNARYGRQSIQSYYQDFFVRGSIASAEFQNALLKAVATLYPDADKERLKRNLKRPQFYFAANHGGFENQPQLLGSSLLTAAAAALQGFDAIFLACTALTPKHATMPAGFLLHSLDDNFKRNKVRFLSNKYNEVFINRCKAPSLQIFEQRLEALPQDVLLPHEIAGIKKVKEALGEGSLSFSDTLLRHNARLYEQALKNLEPSGRCYFVDLDSLTARMIADDLRRHGPFYDLISDRKLLSALILSMREVIQAWREDQVAVNARPRGADSGTVLFYAIDKKDNFCRLSCRIDEHAGRTDLTLLDKYGFSLPLTPDDLLQALEDKRLHPSIFTVNVFLMLFHKVTLAGGIFFDGYTAAMLQEPARLLSAAIPDALGEKRVQGVLQPVKCLGPLRYRDTFNEARSMLHLDLMAIKSFGKAQIEGILSSQVEDCMPLTLSEILLDVEGSFDNLKARKEEILSLLRADAPCTLSFDE